MRLTISHCSEYHYTGPVSFGDQVLRLHPRVDHRITLESFAVQTVPAASERWVRDVYNNILVFKNFGVAESTTLKLDCQLRLTVSDENPFNFILDPNAVAFPFNYAATERVALQPFLAAKVPGADTVPDWFYQAVPQPNRHPDTIQFLADLNSAIRRDIVYQRRDEEGVQSPDQTLELRSGSCRDMAWLFVAACRMLGVAARFTSGYLYDPPVDGSHGGEHLFNRAVGSMHAWSEVYLPGAGWKGFDPTNGILANSNFIPCAVALTPAEAAPNSGKFFSRTPTESSLFFSLDIHED